MTSKLSALDDLAGEMTRRAAAAGAFLIWRAQTLASRSIVVQDRKAERCSFTRLSGHGAHVFSEDGFCALASRDDFEAEKALQELKRAISLARCGPALGLERAGVPRLECVRRRGLPKNERAFDESDATAIIRRLVEIESELASLVPGVRMQLAFRAELESWRIVRSDGADVLFGIPRCNLGLRASSPGNGSRHVVSASQFAVDPKMPWCDNSVQSFLRRSERAARLARELPNAPNHPAGTFPLLIDYALAKGLAHEAFGHAAEADGFRSSVLARQGKLRSGDRVGPDHVSIIDEPLEGDHAWQPYSLNAVPRRRAVLVDHGRLREGLSDPWSAESGDVPLTGAARAQSFRHAPQPRMSNIRIEVDDPLPLDGAFESYGPGEVREMLAQAGIFRRHPHVVWLSGYRGGQVNSATGDFVFHCQAIYDLRPEGIALYRPAIFSGSMFGALRAVHRAFGPLQLDAIGYCGKWGQQVPSSGGSHYFLLLDPEPSIRLGGR